jgi:hypothetical protein
MSKDSKPFNVNVGVGDAGYDAWVKKANAAIANVKNSPQMPSLAQEAQAAVSEAADFSIRAAGETTKAIAQTPEGRLAGKATIEVIKGTGELVRAFGKLSKNVSDAAVAGIQDLTAPPPQAAASSAPKQEHKGR